MSDARPPAGLRLCALSDLPDPGARGFVFSGPAGRTEGGAEAVPEGEAQGGAQGAAEGEAARPFRGVVIRRGAEAVGFVDSCPHVGAPLSADPDRYLTRKGDYVMCFNHGALFRPDDGVCVAGPCVGRALRPWAVAVVDGEVRTA